MSGSEPSQSDYIQSITKIVQSVDEYSSFEGGAALFACTELIHPSNNLSLWALPIITVTSTQSINPSTLDQSQVSTVDQRNGPPLDSSVSATAAATDASSADQSSDESMDNLKDQSENRSENHASNQPIAMDDQPNDQSKDRVDDHSKDQSQRQNVNQHVVSSENNSDNPSSQPQSIDHNPTAVTPSQSISLTYPLSSSQCKELIDVASQAPFGKGDKTLIDRSVRNTWQINAENINIDPETLSFIDESILPRVCKNLGLSSEQENIEAHLYKLLIYETGGHFAPHRDSEKDNGMFGTLVVLLPSQYSGGELCIEHSGKSMVVDWSKDNDWRNFAYAAFYADCKHEIKPVTSGYRVALTFNLCLNRDQSSDDESEAPSVKPAVSSGEESHESNDDKLPSAAMFLKNPPIVHRLAKAFTQWYDSKEDQSLVIALDHQYTQSNLSRDSLKGTDKSLMSLIDRAVAFTRQKRSDDEYPLVIPLLCLLQCTRSGQEECEEEFETTYELSNIVPLSLVPTPRSFKLFRSYISKASIPDFEVLFTDPDFDWDNEDADDEDEEHTGNEGTNIERFYHRAGILLINADSRWEHAAQSSDAVALVATLQKAVSQPNSDLLETLDIAKYAVYSLQSHSTELLSPVLLALSKLKQLAQSSQQAADGSVSSSVSPLDKEISSLSLKALKRAPPDMLQPDTPAQLDRIATSYGIDWIAPFVIGEFSRRCRLVASQPQNYYQSYHRSDQMSIKDASMFLLRFFVLRSSEAINASVSPSAFVSASKKESAGLPKEWIPPVMSMCCSTLYTRVRGEAPVDFVGAVERADNLLKLLVMQWLCLKDQQDAYAADSQQLVSMFEWFFSSLARAMAQRLPVVGPANNPFNQYQSYGSRATTSNVIPSFILTLTTLKQITREAAAASGSGLAPSAGSLEAQLSLMMQEMFDKAPIDFSAADAASEIDRIAKSGGIESIAPLLARSFSERLSNSSLSVKNAAQFLLRFFVLDSPQPSSVAISDLLTGNILASMAQKENAGLPSRWLHSVLSMCSTLYVPLQVQQFQFSLEDDTAFCLLSLFTMHSLCLLSQNSNSGSIQKCISLSERVSVALGDAMKRETANITDQQKFQQTIVSTFFNRLKLLIHLTDSRQEENVVTSLRASYYPLTSRLRKYLKHQLAELTPAANSWVFPVIRIGAAAQGRYSYNSATGLCSCTHCGSVRRFLQSSTERQSDFRMVLRERTHVMECVNALQNPYLRAEIIKTRSPHVLRIIKTQTAHSLFEPIRKPIQDMVNKIELLHAIVKSSKDKISPSSSSSSSMATPAVSASSAQAPSAVAKEQSPSVVSVGSSGVLLPLASGSVRSAASNPFVMPSQPHLANSHQHSSALASSSSHTPTSALSGHKRPREEIEIDSD